MRNKRVSISVIIYGNRAYLPTDVYYNSMYTTIDPVYVSELNVDELTAKILILYQKGNPKVDTLPVEDISSVVLRATGARSWKAMAKTGATYTLYWYDDVVRYSASMVDKKGRWVADPDKRFELAYDTPLTDLAQMILDDWNSRSE